MGGTTGTTILETPPYVIALVFVFFLVVSLGFEKILRMVRHALSKRGKQGLLSAMTNMQNELMCLGVATLILLLFQNSITSYCMSAKLYTKTWLDHVQGCSCCLTRTKGVSPCYLAAKSCVSDSVLSSCCDHPEHITKVCNSIFASGDWDVPNTGGLYTVDSLTGEIAVNTNRRLLGESMMRSLLGGASGSSAAIQAAEHVQCDGRIQTGWEQCNFNPSSRPVIGGTALHQVHIFIFLIAIVHISLGVLLILVASLRQRFWRRWRDQQDPHVRRIQQAVDDHSRAIDAMAKAGEVESQGGLVETGEGVEERTGGSLHPTQLPKTFEIHRQKTWSGRPEVIKGVWGNTKELSVCLLRQFVPHVITKEEFWLMRSAFLLTHHVRSDSGFRYLDYLRNAMEDDFAHVVGLGLPMWCFIILFVLLSSAIGWCIWVFCILCGVILALVNTKLIWIARYVTRGGHVHRLKPGIFFLNRPWLMLHVIKFLLFFVSFTYANAIFFATEFGAKSCFFSSVGFQGQPIPWWGIMVVNTIFLASLSLLTLPLYSVTVQMGGDFKAALMPNAVIENAARAHSLENPSNTGLRALLSRVLPKERDAIVQRSGDSDISKGLVKNPITPKKA